MSDYDISKMDDLMSMPYDAETHIAALTVARDAAQAELTALREKLAAAEETTESVAAEWHERIFSLPVTRHQSTTHNARRRVEESLSQAEAFRRRRCAGEVAG